MIGQNRCSECGCIQGPGFQCRCFRVVETQTYIPPAESGESSELAAIRDRDALTPGSDGCVHMTQGLEEYTYSAAFQDRSTLLRMVDELTDHDKDRVDHLTELAANGRRLITERDELRAKLSQRDRLLSDREAARFALEMERDELRAKLEAADKDRRETFDANEVENIRRLNQRDAYLHTIAELRAKLAEAENAQRALRRLRDDLTERAEAAEKRVAELEAALAVMGVYDPS